MNLIAIVILYDCNSSTGMTALMVAVVKCAPRIVAKLIDLGSDIELINEEGQSALSLANEMKYKNKMECENEAGQVDMKDLNEIIVLLHHALVISKHQIHSNNSKVLISSDTDLSSNELNYVTDIYCMAVEDSDMMLKENDTVNTLCPSNSPYPPFINMEYILTKYKIL